MHLSLGLSLGLSRGLSLALGAGVWGRFPLRLKSTGGPRPSAPLGSRILTNPEDVFKHNMWDHVLWTEEENEEARQKAEENSSELIPLKEQGKYDTDACRYWDGFYETHQDKFFKDRKWLFLEFPELLPAGTESAGTESVGTNGCQGGLKASHPHPSGHGRDMETRPHPCSVPAHRHADATDLQHSCCGDGVESGVPGQRSNTLPGQQSNPLPGQQSNPLPGQQSNPLPGQQSNTFPGQHATFRILEVGCGVGNSVFPIVTSIKEKGAFLYCCDFSPRAIQMVKDHPGYERSVCHAFVHDICEEEEETPGRVPFPPRSLDVILAIFVLSSIHPERVQSVVTRLSGYLKHGGIFLFRDYGRYDLSQLRFKKGQCLSENFYTRQDGTCVYFFTKDEVCSLFSNAGLEEIQNLEDRRLQVNRGKKVVMHRVWMQGKFRKPHLPC